VKNTSAPGGPDLSVVTPTGQQETLSPGEVSGEYSASPPGNQMQFLVSTSDGARTIWLRCASIQTISPAPLQCVGERSRPD
jgi:hypothetical protein